MGENDATTKPPLHIGISGADTIWMEPEGDFIRIRAGDLRAIDRLAREVRRENPGVAVVVDVDVVIAHDTARARAFVEAHGVARQPDVVLYVGIPRGLAGLVADIYALGIADGVVLHPLSSEIGDLIVKRTLPDLRVRGLLPKIEMEAWSA